MLFGRGLFGNDKFDGTLVKRMVIGVLQFNEHFVRPGGKTPQDDGVATRVHPDP